MAKDHNEYEEPQSSNTLSWEEVKDICAEVALLYTSTERDDLLKIEEIKQIQKEMFAMMDSYHADAKTIIRDLTKTVEETEEANAQICPDGEYAKKSEDVEQARSQLEAAINDLKSSEHTSIISGIAEIKLKAEELISASKAVESKKIVDGPRLRLYGNISGIKWKYDAEPGRVKGFVSHGDAGGVRSFDLKKDDYTECTLADALWAAIDSNPLAAGA